MLERAMRNLILLSLLCLAPASRAQAAGVSESLRGFSDAAWTSLSHFKPVRPKTLSLLQLPAAVSAAKTGTRVIRLSGYLNMHGNGYVHPGGSSYISVTLTGWTTLRDDEGRTINGSVYFSDTNSYFVSGSHVSGWARPYAYVTLSENGRTLGTARVDGSISVSGWVSGSSVNLSGSGYVSGTLYVSEPAAQ